MIAFAAGKIPNIKGPAWIVLSSPGALWVQTDYGKHPVHSVILFYFFLMFKEGVYHQTQFETLLVAILPLVPDLRCTGGT